MNKIDFHIYKRRLPHWRLSGSTYFVTWRILPGSKELAPAERALVSRAFHYFDRQRYDLFAYVVMNDHAHCVVRPVEQYPLEKLLHSWKSYTAFEMQRVGSRIGPVWQDEYFDRIMRDEDELREKVEYIFNNPWKRWPEIDKYECLYVNLEPLGW